MVVWKTETRAENRGNRKKLTSDRETPARPIKGNDTFIIEINCRLCLCRVAARNKRKNQAATDKDFQGKGKYHVSTIPSSLLLHEYRVTTTFPFEN